MSQCAVSQATAYSGATLRAHSRVYELSTHVACRLDGLALPSLSPRSHPPLRPITPARAHTLALEPMPPRRGHVKSLSGLWPAGSPWIWHCAQIYLPDLGVALRMGWIRSFQEVHLPRALNCIKGVQQSRRPKLIVVRFACRHCTHVRQAHATGARVEGHTPAHAMTHNIEWSFAHSTYVSSNETPGLSEHLDVR